MKQPYIRDARLMLYSVLAELASIIAAHGSLGFFGFVVGPALAPVYAAVVALGIIGMSAGAGTSKGWPRAGYIGGMFLFLVLETLANYFFAQEHFVARIALAVAPGSDLAGIAGNDFWGRALVVLYLSLASIAVAAFTHKAAHRFAEVRAGVVVERVRVSRVGELRRLVRRLCAIVRQERATTDHLAVQLRQALDQIRQLEAQPRQQTTIEIVNVNGREVSMRQLSEATGVPLTTLRRRVAQLPAPMAQEA